MQKKSKKSKSKSRKTSKKKLRRSKNCGHLRCGDYTCRRIKWGTTSSGPTVNTTNLDATTTGLATWVPEVSEPQFFGLDRTKKAKPVLLPKVSLMRSVFNK